MHALVTGSAGFIGSTLVERLLRDGWSVRGVDCFTPYYDTSVKRANSIQACKFPSFELVKSDLRVDVIDPLLDGVDVVFHLAAQPGVRLSWSDGFTDYSDCNVIATQRLLEAVRRKADASRPISRLVYASSSSVYGQTERERTDERDECRPFSPYGVTKLAGELLCRAYAANFGIPTVSLRYFTVYGPRQRPDMAIHRMIESALRGNPFPLFGTGDAVRDFTFVDDIVDANVRAGTVVGVPGGAVYNVAGGSAVTVCELLEQVRKSAGRRVNVDRQDPVPGDVHRTGGCTARALRDLGWEAQVPLATGIDRQVEWHRHNKPTGGC